MSRTIRTGLRGSRSGWRQASTSARAARAPARYRCTDVTGSVLGRRAGRDDPPACGRLRRRAAGERDRGTPRTRARPSRQCLGSARCRGAVSAGGRGLRRRSARAGAGPGRRRRLRACAARRPPRGVAGGAARPRPRRLRIEDGDAVEGLVRAAHEQRACVIATGPAAADRCEASSSARSRRASFAMPGGRSCWSPRTPKRRPRDRARSHRDRRVRARAEGTWSRQSPGRAGR